MSLTAQSCFCTLVLTSSRAIGISIGENILVSQLLSQIPKFTNAVSPKAVVASGALDLHSLTTSSSALHGLRQAYGLAISAIMKCATVTICISIMATLGMQRLNLVKISKEREIAKEASYDTESGPVAFSNRQSEKAERVRKSVEG